MQAMSRQRQLSDNRQKLRIYVEHAIDLLANQSPSLSLIITISHLKPQLLREGRESYTTEVQVFHMRQSVQLRNHFINSIFTLITVLALCVCQKDMFNLIGMLNFT